MELSLEQIKEIYCSNNGLGKNYFSKSGQTRKATQHRRKLAYILRMETDASWMEISHCVGTLQRAIHPSVLPSPK